MPSTRQDRPRPDVVEKSEILDGSNVAEGDVLLGLASSGPHSNGYSLIRKILEVSNASLEESIDGQPLPAVRRPPLA